MLQIEVNTKAARIKEGGTIAYIPQQVICSNFSLGE
jgi:hypothetical protein